MVYNEEVVKKVIKELKEGSKKRKFPESFDLTVNIKDLDLKQTANQVEFPLHLHKAPKKEKKVCAFVDHEISDSLKGLVDVILDTDFAKYQGKGKECKKLAEKYDFFLAQANLMGKVASIFGKYLGPRKKMPNPKLGGVISAKTDVKSLVNNLQVTSMFSLKKGPCVHVKVGDDTMEEADLLKNIKVIYDTIVQHLPLHENNLKTIYLKKTMSKAIKLDI